MFLTEKAGTKKLVTEMPVTKKHGNHMTRGNFYESIHHTH